MYATVSALFIRQATCYDSWHVQELFINHDKSRINIYI